MFKEIKNSKVLIICSGSTIIDYKDKIQNFIDNDTVVFGCNNMSHVFIPDYHFWADKERYLEFGMNTNSDSIPVFSTNIDEKLIRKYWNKDYLIFISQNRRPKKKEDIVIKYLNNIMYGRFITIGELSIFYAYVHGAKEINVAGMDGYSLYSEKCLKKGKKTQHCYGRGYTDLKNERKNMKIKKYKSIHHINIHKDELIYKSLRAIRDYGVNFKIITPTVFTDFYDCNILEIK